MRALLLLIPFAACTPDVLPGAYACGPDALCPEGQSCNFADNTCVVPALVEPFACMPDIQSEPDDTPDQGLAIQGADCFTAAVQIGSCVDEGDSGDWYRLAVPMNCPKPELDIRTTSPMAFEQLAAEVVDLGTNTTVATDEICDPENDAENQVRCLTTMVTPGVTYGIHIAPNGEGDCGGECAFNKYVLRIGLGG